MSFESELRTHLNVAAVTAYVGDRIHPLLRPQGSALPAVVYSGIGMDPQSNLDGMDGSLRQVRVQIDCWSETFDEVIALGNVVRDRMNTAATNFRSVLLPGAGFDAFEPDTRLYRRSMDFSCWFKEAP